MEGNCEKQLITVQALIKFLKHFLSGAFPLDRVAQGRYQSNAFFQRSTFNDLSITHYITATNQLAIL